VFGSLLLIALAGAVVVFIHLKRKRAQYDKATVELISSEYSADFQIDQNEDSDNEIGGEPRCLGQGSDHKQSEMTLDVSVESKSLAVCYKL
jgi:hypothetical protein